MMIDDKDHPHQLEGKILPFPGVKHPQPPYNKPKEGLVVDNQTPMDIYRLIHEDMQRSEERSEARMRSLDERLTNDRRESEARINAAVASIDQKLDRNQARTEEQMRALDERSRSSTMAVWGIALASIFAVAGLVVAIILK
ncbi:hypothetical protein FACS1894184_05480 [Clostridia bacterium]|nr:hypothetical protein FACS1894184_05480 [Clostridia bacterium]